MAAAVKFYCFTENKNEGVHNLSTAVLKLLLTNTAPSLTATQASDITEIANGNGYTTGGVTLTTTSSGQTLGVYRCIVADYVLTASGGSVGPFRYAVLIDSSADSLIEYWDRGSSVTLTTGQSMTFDFDQTEGVVKDS